MDNFRRDKFMKEENSNNFFIVCLSGWLVLLIVMIGIVKKIVLNFCWLFDDKICGSWFVVI